MNFEVGSIILIKNYPLSSEIKDKFFIVLSKTEKELNLLAMTTSQIYFNAPIKHGKIIEGDASFFCFEKRKIIGKNGFSFKQDTIISNRTNIHAFTNERLEKHEIEYKDCLIDKEFIDLIYSFYSYKGIPKKYKEIFEKMLDRLQQ